MMLEVPNTHKHYRPHHCWLTNKWYWGFAKFTILSPPSHIETHDTTWSISQTLIHEHGPKHQSDETYHNIFKEQNEYMYEHYAKNVITWLILYEYKWHKQLKMT
jgi:hypothetical protein